VDLRQVYFETLARCAPQALVRKCIDPSMPRNVVAIGKCAGALLDGVAAVHHIDAAFVAVPDGYPLPRTAAETHVGGHPHMTPATFEAGRALLAFIDARDDILFLVSGGGSACVEVPLAPHSEEEVAQENVRLIASGLPIAQINAQRRRLSAIKGGRLRDRVRGRAITLVYSDVADDALADVASGPTITSASEAILIADNRTLTSTAAQILGDKAVLWDGQIESDVERAAEDLAMRARSLRHGEVLVAGGEPTVILRGDGRGGRCCELAVRFATRSAGEALLASSDGMDGNSGVAGIYLPARQALLDRHESDPALAQSDSLRIASQVGEPIMIAPTGNNLRDLFLVASNQRSVDDEFVPPGSVSPSDAHSFRTLD
jgi:glycerate-2-kinase